MIWVMVLSCLLALLIIGYCLSIMLIHCYCRELKRRTVTIEKQQHIIKVYDIWIMIKQSGGSIVAYLEGKNIHSIAIYGMAELGNRLHRELKESSISVKYGIDMNDGIQFRDLKIIRPVETDGDVDAVVVTALTTFDIIKGNLEKLGYKNVIALDEILYDLV